MATLNIKSLEEVAALGLREHKFSLSAENWHAIAAAHASLKIVSEQTEQKIYGLHTHYGHNVKDACNSQDFPKHQLQLLNYLMVGTGPVLSESVVRRALRLQAIKCAHGVSGVHPETVRDMVDLSNSSKLSPVPSEGSLGASGDLVSMAHAISSIFERCEPRGPRDVIGLVNTNAVMASFAVELYFETAKMLQNYLDLMPFLIRAAAAPTDAYDERLFATRRPHADTVQFLRSFKARIESFAPPARAASNLMLQHRYSLRVPPMLIDSFHKSLEFTRQLILEEALAVADNPIVVSKHEASMPEVLHGGLFYTSSLAVAVDSLNDIQCKLAELMDRQILNIMDPNLSGGLPDNLLAEDGSHAKGLHQVASALLQRVKSLALPTKSMSFSCESNNQDLVPCTMTALNQLHDLHARVHDIMRVFAFCSLRAFTIRQGKALPANLTIQNWQKFDLEKIEDLKQCVVVGDVNHNGGSYEFCAA